MAANVEDLNDLPLYRRFKAKLYRALMVAFFYNDVRFRQYAEKLASALEGPEERDDA